MAGYNMSIALSGVDKFSGVAQRVKGELKSVGKTAAEVSHATDARPYVQNYRRMGEAARFFYYVQERYIGEARHNFREFGHSVSETADQLRSFSPAFEGLFGPRVRCRGWKARYRIRRVCRRAHADGSDARSAG
jgi:hypothetical protein